MDSVLLLVAQADADKIAKQAKGAYAKLVVLIETYWYISIPAGFVLCFVVFIYIAKWKWSRI